MTAGKAGALGGVLLALVVLGGLALRASQRAREGTHRPPGALSASPARGPASGNVPMASPSASATANAPPRPALPRYTEPVRDRARADALRKLLLTLYAAKPEPRDGGRRALPKPAHAGAATQGMPAPEGTGNQANEALGRYVGRVMREQFVPLAGSCYEELLSRHPEAKGSVTLKFSIMGDESVGGVVVDASLGKGADLGDELFSVCVQESLYSVVFEPPPPGHPTVTVNQSLDLAP